MRRILQIIVLSITSIILVGCSSDLQGNQVSVDSVLKPESAISQKPIARPNKITADQANKSNISDANKEEKVIISINNFGRINPFRPFQEKSLMGENPYFPQLKNVPPPPMPSEDPNVTKLLSIKVSGILYDPNKSSAIINIDKTDYLVHKGDMIFSYYIKDITADKVAIRYGNNVYKAGIGEVIGQINSDPVRGIDKMFGGSGKVSNLPDVKLVNPTYVSSSY